MGFVPLEDLVDPQQLEFVDLVENNPLSVTETIVRGKLCRYYTASRRQLWQARGLEHIEPELLDYIDGIPAGEVFFDAGASNGIFSIYAARCGLRVYAFEPEAQNFALLEMNSFLNHRELAFPIKTFNLALADQDGPGQIYLAKYEPAGHQKILGRPVNRDGEDEFTPEYVQNVMKFSLDSLRDRFSLPAPQHLKIDVDGAEEQLLSGAELTLSDPGLRSIFIELSRDDTKSADIIRTLERHGFKETARVQVQHYQDLLNHVFVR